MMKTKLRKEFDEFKKETQKELFKLKNPQKFKYGEKVRIFYRNFTDAGTAIYKGRDKIVEDYFSGIWTFNHRCFIEIDESMSTWDESRIRKITTDATETTD